MDVSICKCLTCNNATDMTSVEMIRHAHEVHGVDRDAVLSHEVISESCTPDDRVVTYKWTCAHFEFIQEIHLSRKAG